MTADPKPDAVTADHLRKLAALARPCDCAHGCSHDLAYAEIDNMGGWKAIAMGLLDDADKLRAELRSIRALTPPDITAAAARVLLADDVALSKMAEDMTETMRATEKGAPPWSRWSERQKAFAVDTVRAALRALAEVEP